MTSNIRVGTASWTDPELVNSELFYPPEATTTETRLRYYASHFSVVEVDASYYAIPWRKTPPRGPSGLVDFVFNIKAFRLFARHQTDRKALPLAVRIALPPSAKSVLYYEQLPLELVDQLWRQFKAALELLRAAGKLGAVHFQFPKWFVADSRSYAHLDEIRERLAGYVIAIEFRHESWFATGRRDAVLAFERQNQFVNVIVDEPQNAIGSIPAVWEVTNPTLGIVRMHGRNGEQRNKRNLKVSADRFDYDYSVEELNGFVAPIQLLAHDVEKVHVIMNNNHEDQAVRNATSLRQFLGAR